MVEILTKQDLQQFKVELLQEMTTLLNSRKEPKKWVRADEIKKLLRLSPGTLQNFRINGTLQYSRIGNTIFYDFDHIQKLLEKNLVKSHHQPPT